MLSCRWDLRCVKASTSQGSISPSRFTAPNSAILRLSTPIFLRACPSKVPVGGVHHHGGVRNNVGTIVNKAIQIIALAHISEEGFLRPSRKHGRAQPSRRGFVISGKHCGLMTTLGQLADFAHPQTVAEPGPPLGKAYRGQLSRRQAYVGGEKLLLRPILAGIFAIGQACNASVLHLDEKISP